MTRFIYDQFSKDYLETLLNDYGGAEIAKQVPAEIREIDFYFTPTTNNLPPQLGILAKLIATPSLFEPYRNPVTLKEIKDCLLKLLEITAQVQREATRNNSSLIDSDLPRLWIITPTASDRILGEFGARMQLDWASGIYFLPNSLKTAIIVIHQLPVTRETLWLRLLGRGKVQAKAIAEFAALPDDYLFKSAIIEVLYSLQKNLEANKDVGEREDRELMMRLAPLYQEEKAKARARRL